MTALPTDILGEIACYVDDLGTVNAIARTCMAGATIVRELADFIADGLVKYQPPDYIPLLPNGVKHGEFEMPGFDSDTFTVTYCRGAIVSWTLCTEDDTVIRGHRDSHYALILSGNGDRYSHFIGVYSDDGVYHQVRVVGNHRGPRRRLEGYLIDDVIVPSVIEKWAVVAMNLTRPTQPYIVYCNTKKHASALNALGIVDAREYS